MPRKPRLATTHVAHHVVNRGNDRRCIFFEDADYEAFLSLLAHGKKRYSVKVFGIGLMPNHVHAVIKGERHGALSAYVQWVLGRYACHLRWLTDTVGHGHVFQGRFWNDGIEDTRQFLAVLRYVEANPVRAKLVPRAEAWRWSSLSLRQRSADTLLDPLPVALPADWIDLVNGRQPAAELDTIRHPEHRGRPVKATRANPTDDAAGSLRRMAETATKVNRKKGSDPGLG